VLRLQIVPRTFARLDSDFHKKRCSRPGQHSFHQEVCRKTMVAFVYLVSFDRQ
jgi:hypothetical protein